VCSQSEWRVWGLPNCGKGEPQQVMEVAHGVAPARFRQVLVGMGQ
jgi:TldD protein